MIREEIRDVKDGLEKVNAQHKDLNKHQGSDHAMRNLKPNFDAMNIVENNENEIGREGSLERPNQAYRPTTAPLSYD